MNIKGERTRVYLKDGKTTLPLSIITKALEYDSESQIHRWARHDNELDLSQLDSQDWKDIEAVI
jgi:hypothetical protein